MKKPIQNRHDFVWYFDVKDGNPNGDPNNGNMPRMDFTTMQGLVTDVCIKRKIRDYVEDVFDGDAAYNIYVHRGVTLERQNDLACRAVGIDGGLAGVNKARGKGLELGRKIRDYMCQTFFDIRAFGAVFTTFMTKESSIPDFTHVRGPVQLGFARSVDPIVPQDVAISRLTLATEAEARTKQTQTMLGQKYVVPYGLYRMEGRISASIAQHVTGLNEEDLTVLWDALLNMFDTSCTSSSGMMVTRKLIIFRHDSVLGNAPSHKLFERVHAERVGEEKMPHDFSDYKISIDEEDWPDGVTMKVMD